MGASPHLYATARRHLGRRDPVLRRLMTAVGPCRLRPDPDHFLVLVRTVISQMISTTAAHSVFARLEYSLGRVTPGTVLVAGETALRAAGLSRTKAGAILDLAARVRSGELPLDDLAGRDDDEVAGLLLPVRGVGVWTVEMFLMFSLGRQDVLPVGDFGLRAGVRDAYGLAEMPDAADLRARAEPWRPYRTVATWYFWRSRGFVPQSE